jgi:hypothetical protein
MSYSLQTHEWEPPSLVPEDGVCNIPRPNGLEEVVDYLDSNDDGEKYILDVGSGTGKWCVLPALSLLS